MARVPSSKIGRWRRARKLEEERGRGQAPAVSENGSNAFIYRNIESGKDS
jgi:hypothetical protein